MTLEDQLENLYAAYNRRHFVHPDPLEFLYRYPDVADLEIAGMVASALAYGRVEQILKSVSAVLDVMGRSPARFIRQRSPEELVRQFEGFRHRFATGVQLSGLLIGLGVMIKRFGSLQDFFADQIESGDQTVMPALERFTRRLSASCPHCPGHLMAMAERGSACKRLNLFLRWMVRRDDVDPGGWTRVFPRQLVIPLDTHMHRVARAFGFTSRKQADRQAALETTQGFRRLAPEDPVRYDFALTRLGIRGELSLDRFLLAVCDPGRHRAEG